VYGGSTQSRSEIWRRGDFKGFVHNKGVEYSGCELNERHYYIWRLTEQKDEWIGEKVMEWWSGEIVLFGAEFWNSMNVRRTKEWGTATSNWMEGTTTYRDWLTGKTSELERKWQSSGVVELCWSGRNFVILWMCGEKSWGQHLWIEWNVLLYMVRD
jgi:hypothetical protein